MRAHLSILCLLWLLVSPCSQADTEEFIRPTPVGKATVAKLALTPAESAWLTQSPVVRVAVRSGWMPMEFQLENARHRGLAIDYLQRISRATGLVFQLVNYRPDIRPDEVDMIASVSGQQIPLGFQRLAQPYLVIRNAIYINQDSPILSASDDPHAFERARVAVFKHGLLPRQLHAHYPQMQLVHVDIADEAFDALEHGLVDAYIGNELVIDYHIDYHRLAFVRKLGTVPMTSQISMAASSQAPLLASVLEKGLASVSAEQTAIIQPWLAHAPSPAWYTHGGVVLLGLLCAGLLYQLWRIYRKAQQKEALARQQIWQQANFDFLTGLPNRYLLHSRLTQAIEEARAARRQLGLLLIDLDGFKDVNDTAGHATGDRLLQAAASRIQACVRKEDMTAKLGGDEFVVIITGLVDSSALHVICQNLLQSMRRPFNIDDKPYFVTASIGVTVCPDNGNTAESLMMFADQAMYAAKNAGKNQYQLFTQAMQTSINARLSLVQDLRLAIQRGQLYLEYQPILSSQQQRLYKVEALLRWKHPAMGNIPPDIFIPLAEESGLIIELGEWLFSEILQSLPHFPSTIADSIEIGINISPTQFAHPQHLLRFIQIVQQHGMPCQRFCFEITEGLLLAPSAAVVDVLEKIRSAGIKLSIDDFGTGYSALAYLKNYRVDYVKIDKSFTRHLAQESYDLVLCRSIIQMAHELRIKVIAEGVENEAQAALLQQIHCDFVQGYLYGKPGPITEVCTHLQ